MRLTKADGEVLLGAIAVELESQRWRKMRREEYSPPLEIALEQSIQRDDERRATELRVLREKIKAQIRDA